MITDAKIANNIRWCKEHLRDNEPVRAYDTLRELETYLSECKITPPKDTKND